ITAKPAKAAWEKCIGQPTATSAATVALKILPQPFASDADRMARFECEAKVLAALNHPNIAQIYGVEHRALVMELVEGEILSRRVGPVAFEDVWGKIGGKEFCMFGVPTSAFLICLMAGLGPTMAQTSAQRPPDRQAPAKASSGARPPGSDPRSEHTRVRQSEGIARRCHPFGEGRRELHHWPHPQSRAGNGRERRCAQG